MKRGLTDVSTLLTGGVLSLAGLVISFAVAFFAMFYVLRLVCWLTGNDDWMFLMWFGIILVPAGGILSFALCAIGFTAYIERHRTRQRHGFEVVGATTPHDPG
jgi:hypothetical protein